MTVTPNDTDRLAETDLSFDELAASRRLWIEDVLQVWCRRASLSELRRAELEWLDIAGRVDVEATLWTWAWERFPEIVHPEFPGVNETHELHVSLINGESFTGFPDARRSRRGMLYLVGTNSLGEATVAGPFSIDQITSIARSGDF